MNLRRIQDKTLVVLVPLQRSHYPANAWNTGGNVREAAPRRHLKKRERPKPLPHLKSVHVGVP